MPRAPDLFSPREKLRKAIPFDFLLDRLSALTPTTRPMFGCVAVYVGERIVMILRDKGKTDPDNGVWLAYEPEHEAEVMLAFPRLEPIQVFGDKVRGWRKLSARSADFEDDVILACTRIHAGDAYLGKIPGKRKVLRAKKKLPLARSKTAPSRRGR